MLIFESMISVQTSNFDGAKETLARQILILLLGMKLNSV